MWLAATNLWRRNQRNPYRWRPKSKAEAAKSQYPQRQWRENTGGNADMTVAESLKYK
jgi:hypothetical protein